VLTALWLYFSGCLVDQPQGKVLMRWINSVESGVECFVLYSGFVCNFLFLMPFLYGCLTFEGAELI